METVEGRKAAIAASDKPYAIITDHSGNYIGNGLPDIERNWSLEGKKGRPKPSFVNGTCKKCFNVWTKKPHEPTVCPVCGWVPEKKERKGARQVDGELTELGKAEKPNPWAFAANKPLAKVLSMAKTHADLVAIAKARGFKSGWAFYKAKELGIYR